jgi:hypothetical protein
MVPQMPANGRPPIPKRQTGANIAFFHSLVEYILKLRYPNDTPKGRATIGWRHIE